ncbi:MULTISPECIES: hypothetical protein [unclassified Micromonospora]|nr:MULTISPECIES: hypothetical protein [unclassified Micromonospora]MDM4777827.1 hypothetical protein [Micromonospora sp. b486]MDM4779852.1 hypothetical protein [Micromonospora sp. b486]
MTRRTFPVAVGAAALPAVTALGVPATSATATDARLQGRHPRRQP